VRWTVVSSRLAGELAPLVDWRRAPAPARPFRAKLPLFAATATARAGLRRGRLLHVAGPLLPLRADLVGVHFLRDAFYDAIGAERSRSTRLHVELERRFLSRARALATPSTALRRELERRFPGKPVFLVPNGVDLNRFHPDAAARTLLRREVGTGADTFVALFVGNAYRQKGLVVAIAGLAAAARAGVDCELWVVGLGSAERYRDRAREGGVDDRVRFFGSREDVDRFYQAADAFVLPSVYEVFPLAAMEAAASELPIVATAVGGIDDLVGEGEAGFVVERDAEAVAAALEALVRDPGRRAAMAAAARRRALGYTWERSVESLLEAYRSLAAQRSSE
jgi:UDP-glucose:(heptosyl)LPS alpha-1,3-glucosyltransferase